MSRSTKFNMGGLAISIIAAFLWFMSSQQEVAISIAAIVATYFSGFCIGISIESDRKQEWKQ